MRKLFTLAKKFARRETGATAVEYALLVAAIAIGIIIGVQVFGQAVLNLFQAPIGKF